MKKTLAIVLALVMVLSVMAMVPASAANESVLGWHLYDANGTLTQVGNDKVKLTSVGKFDDNAAWIISDEKVDLFAADGFTVKFTNVTCAQESGDRWICVAFVGEQKPFTLDTSKVHSSATTLFNSGNFQFGYVAPGSNFTQAADSGSTSKYAASINGKWLTSSACDFDLTYKFEGEAKEIKYYSSVYSSACMNMNQKQGNKIKEFFPDGKAYVAIGLQSSEKKTFVAEINGLKVASNPSTPSSSTDPTPATGDFTAVYALVAVIACGVVVGSTVVLKKKED